MWSSRARRDVRVALSRLLASFCAKSLIWRSQRRSRLKKRVLRNVLSQPPLLPLAAQEISVLFTRIW